MRNIPKIVMSGLVLCLLMAFTTISRSFNKQTTLALEAKPAEIIIPELLMEPIEIKIEVKGHDAFLQAIGHRESGNRYDIVNTYGYMGRYQFGKSTLKGLGFDVTTDEFINSPYIQEKAMHKLLLHNKKKLDKFIDKYEGEVLHGVLITESGVLAAAHLAGAGNVRKFFRKGYEFKDGFGTKMTSYMTQFSGYSLNL
jgi:hypothetical protein